MDAVALELKERIRPTPEGQARKAVAGLKRGLPKKYQDISSANTPIESPDRSNTVTMNNEVSEIFADNKPINKMNKSLVSKTQNNSAAASPKSVVGRKSVSGTGKSRIAEQKV